MTNNFSLEFPKELGEAQLNNYKEGRYKVLFLPNHAAQYHPDFEKEDSDALMFALRKGEELKTDTTSSTRLRLLENF